MKRADTGHIDIYTLYLISRISLIVVLVLGLFILISLYVNEKTYIVLWYICLVFFILFRLREASIFFQEPQKYSLEKWYKRFFIFAILTAILFSFLGIFFFVDANISQKYYIIFVLIGLATASVPALSVDIKLNIVYTAILLLPLSIIIFYTKSMPLHTLISATFLLYFLSQIFIINESYMKKKKIDHLETHETLLHSLFKNAPLGVFMYNKDLEIIDCNDELGRIFNYKKENIIGMNLKQFPDQRFIKIFQNPFVTSSNIYEGLYHSKEKKTFWMEAKAFTIGKRDGEVFSGIGIIEDKTKEHNALEKLEYLVNHDVLTTLLNRRGLSNAINDIVNHKNHNSYYSILFYLDLNQFKSINDSLGHGIGDKVLLSVSKRLASAVTISTVISRLGGDEFVFVVPYVSKDIEETKYKAKEISITMQSIFQKPFIIEEMHLYMSASIGIVIMEPQYKNIEEILRHADLTMYQSKKTNRHIAYYNSSLDEQQKDLFILQHDLAHAQNKNELKLFLQPIVGIKNNSLYAAELLLRWEHPTRGVLSPDKFIPLAIKAGLLSKITWWLVESVCQQIQQWKNEGKWDLKYISININPHQLLENNFTKELIDKLEKYNVDKSEIILEITEQSLIDNFENTQGIISELKQSGVKCAIDDFGIGYSSLSYLKRLSFHTLKIDKEFVKDIAKNPTELKLIQTILDIGRQFNYNIIIEGIESNEQVKALMAIDEELYYQGYLYSKALPIEMFDKKFLS